MKLTVDSEALAAAATWAARRVPTSPPMPVIGGLVLQADREGLRITGTDLDLWGTALLAASVAEPGVAVVSANLLAKIAKTLGPGDEVQLDDDGTRMQVRCATGRWSVPVLPDREDFPATPAQGDLVGRVDPCALAAALPRTLLATSTLAQMPTCGAVVLTWEGSALRVVATDLYRLAIASLEWEPGEQASGELIVPGEVLKALGEALRTESSAVSLASDGNTVSLHTRHRRITGRLQAGYANWRKLEEVPAKASAAEVAVPVGALLRAAGRAGVELDDKTAAVLEISDGQVWVSDAVRGNPHCAEVLRHDGPPVRIHVASRWLAGALGVLDAPSAVLSFGAKPTYPFVIRPGDEQGQALPGYQHILCSRLPPAG